LSRRGERPTLEALATLPVAVDAMGGDKSPFEIVQGARRVADEHGIPVVLVGPPEQVGDTMGLPLVACTEVIAMDEDPAGGVRRKKDSSLVRAAEMVRDGQASAMVSAGNTGATMAAALLRMGRLPGVVRPCIATPLPRLGRSPAVLVDAGANAECTSAMLLQFAQMGAAYVAARFGTAAPSVGLLSIGEEPTKGTPLVKETHALLAAGAGAGGGVAGAGGGVAGAGFGTTGGGASAGADWCFIGNLEGRDLLPSPADVIVTDGFTGNVALKALEGTLRFIFDVVIGVFGIDDETKAAADVLLPHLLPLAAEFEPENTGGAMLLGTDGVCVISHGSSNATAIVNAVRVAYDCATRGLVDHVAAAVRQAEKA
jgi:phosphate acyltransferase